MLYRCLLASLFIACPMSAFSEGQITASVPSGDQGSYDPQMTAKQAVLTNWKLAVSGLRAGKYVSDNVAHADGLAFDELSAQAEFAAETMLLRYASSYWVFAMDDALTPVDPSVLLTALNASRTNCVESCDAAGAALAASFADVSAALEGAAVSAEQAAVEREAITDTAALSELLTDMALYLESPAWHSDLSFTEAGLDGAEVSGRVVGTLAVWRNVEPFVGLKSQEIDDAVNAASNMLLRDVRRQTHRKEVLSPESDEIAIIRASADAVAVELRRAAALFQEG